MRQNTLGASGIVVSDLAFGAMNFGFPGGPDDKQAVAMVHRALDAGINLVDTADVYTNGESERVVGLALKGRRDDVVLATKFGLPMGEDPNRAGGSPRWIRRAVEDSLRRLGTDHIDLYQMHRPDYRTALDETLSALSDLVREGKIRAIGSSTFPPELIVAARWAAEKGGHRPFVTEQPRYSVFNRRPETHVFPALRAYGMGALTYAPLASGWLAGRAEPGGGPRARMEKHVFDLDSPANRAKVRAAEELRELADGIGVPMTHLALAFVRAHPAVSTALIGPRTPEQLDDLLAAADVTLDAATLDRIDEIVAPGSDLNPADNYDAEIPALADKTLRRRA
ncbi:aldo/keto reductase [Streptomyces sp. NPDC006684]|uniref:aldo/keto reductase n=1 Tax=unclassified Streptomyces TaxID=2593676 RepID=UPI00101030A4|nr:aldo/keto reductase [Streptomyces sp. GZWMJZ-114]